MNNTKNWPFIAIILSVALSAIIYSIIVYKEPVPRPTPLPDSRPAPSSPSDSVSPEPQLPNDDGTFRPPSVEIVSKTGVIGCLAHRDTSGPQTMECAFGLETQDGKAYGLRSDNPTAIGSYPTGSLVRVDGFLDPTPLDRYDADGTITVKSIQLAQ